MSQTTKLELFCGTGGVGKTTLATSRAISLAKNGQNVLLITIDPAKRLKQILGLSDEKFGEIEDVTLGHEGDSINFKASLLNPKKTFEKITGKSIDVESNPILKVLTRPYGGLNEIMSVLEVQYNLDNNNFDYIILDTPPGQHFIDFIEAAQKIETFFDNSFLDLFVYLNKKIENVAQKQSFMKKVIGSGIKKLLGYLEIVTGPKFVEIFIDTIYLLNLNKNIFLKSKDFQSQLKSKDLNTWYVVTSVEQSKSELLASFIDQFKTITNGQKFILMNKSVSELISDDSLSKAPSKEKRILNSMQQQELGEIEKLKTYNIDIKKFNSILQGDPLTQTIELAKAWD